MSITFGNKLKILRKNQNITQQEIANAVGTVKGTVSKWEKSTLEPSIETIKKIASFLEISTDELLDFQSYEYSFEYQHENTKLSHKEKR